MFLLCQDHDGYLIYYNYENNKLYGCYNSESKAKPNYNLVLILPFINVAVKLLSQWLLKWNVWGMRLICILIILVTIICIHAFWAKIYNSSHEYRKRRFSELPDPSPEDWNYYLEPAKKLFKEQIRLYIWMSLGTIVSIGLFLWNGFILFYLLFMLFYLFLHLIILFVKPIRKYKFIKSKKGKL